MRQRSLRLMFACFVLLIIAQVLVIEARKVTKSRRKKTLSKRTATRRSTQGTNPRNSKPESQVTKYRFHSESRDGSRYDVINNAILALPELHRFLRPIRGRGSRQGRIGRTDFTHLHGTVRKKRMYCRAGIGFHLVINAKGKVRTRHKPTKNGILEMFSVNHSVVGFRSATHRKRYLCMNKAGKLLTRRSFRPDCQFRERIEGNKFNTYASEQYSDHIKREGYFLAINRNGKIPRRLRRGSWKQKRAHWLPRKVKRKR